MEFEIVVWMTLLCLNFSRVVTLPITLWARIAGRLVVCMHPFYCDLIVSPLIEGLQPEISHHLAKSMTKIAWLNFKIYLSESREKFDDSLNKYNLHLVENKTIGERSILGEVICKHCQTFFSTCIFWQIAPWQNQNLKFPALQYLLTFPFNEISVKMNGKW